MNFRPLPILWMLLAFAWTSRAQTNWPSFRGTFATGVSPGKAPPTVWDVAKSKNILWKTPIPGLGHSCPVIWGDRVFVTTAVNQQKQSPLKVGLYGDVDSAEDNEVQQWRLLCLNKRTGTVLWSQTVHEGVPKLKRHMKASHANCTVTTDGTHVVAFFGSEGLYCFDMDGKLRWQRDFGLLRTSPVIYEDKPFAEGIDLEWGFASSPVLHENRVYLQCDVLTNSFIAALDVADGKQIWKTPRADTATWSTPTVCLESPRPQLIVNGWRHMGGYDLQTGEEIWKMSGGGDCPVPTPIVSQGLIFLTSAHGPRRPMYAVRLDATGDISLQTGTQTNRSVVWSALRGGSYMQTPLAYGEFLYSSHVDGVLSCYDLKTGRQWYKERLGRGGDGFTASPVAAGGKIYFTSEQGVVVVLKVGATYNVMATNPLGELCMATPAISDGVLFFRTQGHLIAVGEKR